jgi:hypothetical protein
MSVHLRCLSVDDYLVIELGFESRHVQPEPTSLLASNPRSSDFIYTHNTSLPLIAP